MIWIDPSPFKQMIPWAIWKGSNAGCVHITFDDGPHPYWTPVALRILRETNTQAIFFLNGNKVLKYPDIVQSIEADGHVIGNHGFSHQPLLLKKRQTVYDEIMTTNQAIYQVIGRSPVYFRPPYGRFDFRFKKLMATLHMQLVIWSLMTYDFNAKSAKQIQNTVKQHLHPSAILVFHDGHANTELMVNALRPTIDYIQEQGYDTSVSIDRSWSGA